ncbi:glycosyl hydrolase family 35 protein [Rutstroemia sp. NJR-2017a WRK4]|nr:glycosyl hydrolase family 35 protein [Rutstroemia sp. NJR-2017a WRK4]
MRFLSLLLSFSLLLWSGIATNDGLTDAVEWDPYSLTVNGERVFIFSAEFHYQRMPVPELWLDIFHKFKANGFNAIREVSLSFVYFFWSYHEASKGNFDFETSGKNVQKVLDYAKEAGLWVIARAGPYCNAETNGGGLALWGSDGSMGSLRTSQATYYASWQPWVAKIGAIIAKNEITKGGPVILNQVENELQETTHSANNTLVLYMQQLETAYRAAGITVPLSHNEKGQRSISWSTDYQNVGGAVNVYGLDSYPGGLSCTNPDTGFNLVRNYYQWFSNYSYTQPNYFPEFEGGYFTPWGGSFYDDCESELDPAFADVYYKNNIGQRTTLMSLYMAWGGTNWGHYDRIIELYTDAQLAAAPVVYTSYDYAAPLRETRQIRDKLSQTKLIGLFTRVSKDLLKTEMIGNGTGYSVSSPSVWSWVLRNPDTQAGFTTLQQATSSSRASITFDVYLNTTEGAVTVPNVNLNGRQSKILVTDYGFGKHTLLFSSADILTYSSFDKDVLVLYLQQGQVGQFAFKSQSRLTYQVYGQSNFTHSTLNKNGTTSRQTFTYVQGLGQTVVHFSNGALIYLLDVPTAWKFWAPATTSSPSVNSNEQIFVLGPYLVRSASLSYGTLKITGDNDKATSIEVYGGNAIHTITWNGRRIDATKTRYGSFTAKISGTEHRTISLPKLTKWRSGDSLPEKSPSYDDTTWTVCNKTKTLSPIAPLTLPVLFSSDYGFYTGPKIYRGYFDGLNYTSVNLTCSGGLAFGWSAWLNGNLLGSHPGNASLTTTNLNLPLTNLASPLKLKDNLLTVVVDYHGHDETSTSKGVENPRGILGASLLSSSGSYTNSSSSTTGFKLWKIRGNAGGSANIDPVRGPMNEGGFYLERLGYHLPSSPTLPSFSSPFSGSSEAGIHFYSTTFNLNIDADLDVPLGIQFAAAAGTVARITLWVNGYQFGKYVPHIGPQTTFPVPPGVLNNRGVNYLVLGVWGMQDVGARLQSVELVKYGVYETGFKGGFAGVGKGLQPGWESGVREAWG